jgi:hypothetical protein
MGPAWPVRDDTHRASKESNEGFNRGDTGLAFGCPAPLKNYSVANAETSPSPPLATPRQACQGGGSILY